MCREASKICVFWLQFPRVMKNFVRILSVSTALVIFGSCAAVLAQTPRPTPPDDDGGQVKTFEVRLPVTVTQKKTLITGLSRGDFSVFEDGVQQEITFFTDEKTNPPVYVGLLMDTSPSTAGKLDFSKEAAKS